MIWKSAVAFVAASRFEPLMELREYAERIVFATTLDEKLAAAEALGSTGQGTLTDLEPGPAMTSIRLPGRPPELALHLEHDARAQVTPNITKIHDERERGVLLHFLANHELLATELMALVLLKFPDAPAAFRQGVLATLREEQAHTRLYLNRMHDCGVSFGEFPVSGYFWRMVESMQSPLDFVSRLSLTFEQANLDYAHFYAARFEEAGDRETASILNAIYLDEIGHVNHGLTWFRQWKDAGQSDWSAYQAALDFPLSPVRAKATQGRFNRQGRLDAGLDPAFVDQLELFRQSRGRMPVVRWFYPAAEEDLIDVDCGYSSTQEAIAADLESLLFPLSAEDDVALLRTQPAAAFLKQLVDAKLSVPEILPFPVGKNHPLCERKIDQLAPWAWTLRTWQDSRLLVRVTNRELHLPVSCDTPFRKSWSVGLFESWLAEATPAPDWITGPETCGIVLQSLDELDSALAKLAARGCETALFKVDLGAAGRGQRRLDCRAGPTSKDLEILKAAVAPLQRGYPNAPVGIVEPHLDRVLDLSLQWVREPPGAPGGAGLHFLGWTRQLIQPGRRYVGSVLGQPFADLPILLKRFLVEDGFARLKQLEQWLRPRLDAALATVDYHGPFGVDVLVAGNVETGFTIKPLVELNPRHTMGMVALRLEKRIATGRSAQFLLLTKRQIRTLGFASFSELADSLASAHPVEHAQSGMHAGFIPLADPAQARRLLPVLAVGRSAMAEFEAVLR